MTAPTNRVMVNSACGIWLGWMPETWITLAVDRAIALVRVLIIRIDRVVSDATIVEIIPEYRP